MDIQKLAAELGLNCIKTFKLDALKAVCRRDESDVLTGPFYCDADNDVKNEVSDSPILHAEGMSSFGIEKLNIEKTVEENGRYDLSSICCLLALMSSVE